MSYKNNGIKHDTIATIEHSKERASAELEQKAHIFYKLAVVKDRRYRFRTYRSTFVGKEIVDSMVICGLAQSREQAVELGREIAENFDLFESCEKSFLSKKTLFEDDPGKLYRFTSGALMVIRKMNEEEMRVDENKVTTVFTVSSSTISNQNRSIRGPGLQRQNGIRTIESFTNWIEDDASDDDVQDKHEKLCRRKKKLATRPSRTSMYTVIEEEENRSQSSNTFGGTKTSDTTSTEVKCKRFNPKSTNQEFVIGDSHKSKIRQRDESFHKTFDSRSIAKITTSVNAKEKATKATTRHGFQLGSDHRISPIDEFDTEAPGDYMPLKAKCPSNMDSRRQSTRRFGIQNIATNISTPATDEQVVHDYNNGQIDLRPTDPSFQKEESVKHLFVTSREDLPACLRRRMSDYTESFDNFEFILNKKEGNLLTQGSNDDDQSIWTEYIIGDEQGRKQYRLNDVEETCSSQASSSDHSSISDVEYAVVNNQRVHEGTIDEKALVCRLHWEPSEAAALALEKVDDDESYMDFTVFDNTVAISYVEDDEDYVATEDGSVREDDDNDNDNDDDDDDDDERSLFHIITNRDPVSGGGIENNNDDDDDDMTQITMDNALMLQPENEHHNAAFLNQHYPSSMQEAERSHSGTSKNRIQTILWHDLTSCDFSVVRSAMEELRRIVASEPQSRNHVVRTGGVMAIMGTMEKYLKQEFIQYHCCVLIELLASMEPDAMKAFNEMKGIQMIVCSMQDQAESDRVQDAGRAALATLCRMHQPGAGY